jgi:choline-sulfatase
MGLMSDAGARWDDVAFSEYCNDRRLTRMVRRGSWKLNYYHGYDPQLFNLDEDPRELCDRARDPGCQGLRRELEALVLEEWDPERVAGEIAAIDGDLEILKAWAQRTDPEERYRWDLRPEMDYLD